MIAARSLSRTPRKPDDPIRADGRLMKAEANLKTGEIKWTLFAAGTSPDFFTGTGVVIKID